MTPNQRQGTQKSRAVRSKQEAMEAISKTALPMQTLKEKSCRDHFGAKSDWQSQMGEIGLALGRVGLASWA